MKYASKQWHNNSDQHTKGRDMLVRTNACQTDRGLASDVWTVALNEILR